MRSQPGERLRTYLMTFCVSTGAFMVTAAVIGYSQEAADSAIGVPLFAAGVVQDILLTRSSTPSSLWDSWARLEVTQFAGYTGDPSPEGSWSLIALRSSSILAMMVMNS
jgi:hypothetical protein